MWQKIKQFNEERGQALADMKALLQKANDEKRDLTAEENTSFDTLAAYQGWNSLVLTGRGEPARVVVNCVTPSYLTLLGARTQLGRVLRPEEDRVGSGDAVVLLSHAFWQRQLGM